jgi:hypothetical protein
VSRTRLAAALGFSLLAAIVFAQQAPAPPAASTGSTTAPAPNATVRGCLDGERGNYIVIENKTSMVYVLKGVGNKLDSYLGHEVEVKGTMLPGTIKTGVRPEKAGSNPADTVRGVSGIPLRVADVRTDVRTISKHCKAADQE